MALIGLDINKIVERKNCNYFLIHQIENLFWVLKRTVSIEPSH